MFYPEEVLEEVKSRVDIVDVVGSYVKLKKSGQGYVGLCPFHHEKTPSFSVSATRQFFHCFGCGKGGDVFRFVKEYENITFPEAVEQLAERVGVKLPEREMSGEAKARKDYRERLLAVNKEAAKFYYYLLRSPQGKTGMEYLKGRGLTEETLHRFGLGFAPSGREILVRHLRGKGFQDSEIRDAALAKADEKWGMHDLFWNRVMFPIQDANHRVIGFGGRVMGQGEPKYLNSLETPIFDKSRNLYGLQYARSSRKKRFILCEGYMDVIAQHQAGFSEAVASLGTSFTQGQAAILKKYAEQVFLAYDSDGAGQKAAIRAANILKDAGISAKVISLKPYKDPDEFIKNLGSEAYEERIRGAENAFLFEIRMLWEGIDPADPDARTRFAREAARRVLSFEEAIERDNYIEAIAAAYSINPQALREQMAAQAGKMEREARYPVRSKEERDAAKERKRGRSEKLMLKWCFEEPEALEKAKAFLTPEDFTYPHTGEIAQALWQAPSGEKISFSGLLSRLSEEAGDFASGFLSEPLAEWESGREKEKAFTELIRNVKQNSLAYYSEGFDLSKVVEIKKKLSQIDFTKGGRHGRGSAGETGRENP
ncbi:MAG: DNA primase [Lachnospiraceae bacterium]|nr:DNA primase [Lachnospiraceae bacterium]